MRSLRLSEVLELAGLASVRTLRADGLCPGDGCAPVGAFRGVPLWRRSDAVPLVLSSGRRAVLVRNRTCSVCGATSTRPWPLGPDRRTRFCHDHFRDAWESCWIADHRAAMGRCAEWARSVLADPSSVVVGFDVQPGVPGRFVAVDFCGVTLADEVVELSRDGGGRHILSRANGKHPDRLIGLLACRTLVSAEWWQVGRLLAFVPGSGCYAVASRVHQADWWVGQWVGAHPVGGVHGVRFDDAVKPYRFPGDVLNQAKDVVFWVDKMLDSVNGSHFAHGDSNA